MHAAAGLILFAIPGVPLMIIPLDTLIANMDNVYEFTCASIRRASGVMTGGTAQAEDRLLAAAQAL